MLEVIYKIKSKIGEISSKNGWTKELNLISWNGKEEKYDIRSWNNDHTKMSKGITFTKEELERLKELLINLHFDEISVNKNNYDGKENDLLEDLFEVV